MLTVYKFTTRLKKAYLVCKINLDNKIKRINRKITSDKTKYLEVSNN